MNKAIKLQEEAVKKIVDHTYEKQLKKGRTGKLLLHKSAAMVQEQEQAEKRKELKQDVKAASDALKKTHKPKTLKSIVEEVIKKSNIKADAAGEVAKAITKATSEIEAKVVKSIVINAAKHHDDTKPGKSTKEIVKMIT